MENLFIQLGFGGIGFFFMWQLMKQSADKDKTESQRRSEELQTRDRQIDKLCDKIEKMVDVLNEMTAKDVQKLVTITKTAEELIDMYIRIANRIDRVSQTVEAIDLRTKLCPKIQKLLEDGVNCEN